MKKLSILFILTTFVLLLPVVYSISDRDEFYRSHERVENNGRYEYTTNNPYKRDNYIVDYDDNYVKIGYGDQYNHLYSDKKEYEKSGYGDDSYLAHYTSGMSPNHAYYVTDGYGTSTGNTNIWSTHYVKNGYGTSNSGSSGNTYVKVGTVSYGDPGDSDYNYIDCNKPNFYAKTPKQGEYKTYHIPVGENYAQYKEGYEYKVKVYKVKQKGYAFDGYPLN